MDIIFLRLVLQVKFTLSIGLFDREYNGAIFITPPKFTLNYR